VEARIESCSPVGDLLPERVAYWRSEVARVTKDGLAVVEPDWEAKVQQMAASRPGVVLTLSRQRGAWFEERVWRWNQHDRRLGTWSDGRRLEKVFLPSASGSCDTPPPSEPRRYLLCFERSQSYPPSVMPGFLSMSVLHELPAGATEREILSWAFRVCPP